MTADRKIGYLVSRYPAPSHTFIRREVEALRRRGLEVDTFSIRPPDARDRLGPADTAERARTYYVLPARAGVMLLAQLWALARPLAWTRTLRQAVRHRVPGLKAWLWSLFYFVEAITLARELERRRIQHLHNHFANAGAIVGMLACHFSGIEWSLTLHGISEFDYPAGPLLPDKLSKARFAACVSSFGMAQAMRITPPHIWPKLLIVRCGLDLAAMPAPARRDGGPLRVVCVGRLSSEKGHVGLIQAFREVVARGPAAELRLIGDGPERARIEAAIAEAGLGDRCTLLGQLPERETLAEVAQSDVLVSASFMEGLPVVLMEALALNVAVVAPRVAGVPELVEDGVTGLLYTPADWKELVACLSRALGDRGLRERTARAGQERVRREFDADRACEPIYRLLAQKEPDPAPEISSEVASPARLESR
jgi:colanic acid/amylovoran biosynthesis glycosyltransferase